MFSAAQKSLEYTPSNQYYGGYFWGNMYTFFLTDMSRTS